VLCIKCMTSIQRFVTYMETHKQKETKWFRWIAGRFHWRNKAVVLSGLHWVRLLRNSKQKDYGIEETRTKWLGEKGVSNNGAHQPKRTQYSYLLFLDRRLYVFSSDKPIDLFLSLLLPVGMESFSGGVNGTVLSWIW